MRLSAYGGLGTFAEDESASRSTLSLVGGDLSVLAVPGLDLGLGTEASFYERRYLLTLPDAQGGAGGDVTLAETRVRSTLHVGYDVIDGTGVGGGAGGLVIALRGTVDTFLNEVVPQTAVNLGGELRGWGRVAGELLLDAGLSWLAAVYAGEAEVLSRLALGGVASDLRWGAGASLVLEPRARVRLSYAGEWLALVHAARVAHSVNLEVSIDL